MRQSPSPFCVNIQCPNIFNNRPLPCYTRAASTPYEMAIASYLPDGFSVQTGLLLFSIIFFALSFFISLYPTKLFDSLGKVMTPVLLILILLVCVMGCAILVREEFSCLEFHMNRDTINWILKN